MSLLVALARHRFGRFLIDVWFGPRTAWRRLTMKRTWPTPDEFARMSDAEFGAYLRKIGMREASE